MPTSRWPGQQGGRRLTGREHGVEQSADDEQQPALPPAVRASAGAMAETLRERRGLRAVVANISWLWADSLVLFAASFAGGIVVARALGPAGYGLLGYASGLMGLLLPLAGLGTQDLAVRDLVAAGIPPGRVLGTTFALQAVGSLLAFALAWAASSLLNDAAATQRVTIIVSLSMLATPLNVPGYWFAARLRAKYAVWARDGALLACTLLRVALALSGAPVAVFAWLAVAQAFLAGVALFVLARGRMPGLRAWEVSLPEASRLLREGWPLLASGLAVALYMKIDLVMLGHLAGADAVGQYTAAVRLSELWHVAPMAISVSVFPALVRARDDGALGQGLAPFMQALYDLMAVLGFVVAVPLSLLAKSATWAVYGAGYAESGPILAAHIWSLVFVCLGLARGRWLVASHRTHLLLYTSLLGAGANVGLNLLLIPRYGAQGAAWAAVASQAVANYGSCLLWPALREPLAQMSRALLLPFRARAAWRGIVTVWKGSALEPAAAGGGIGV